jgi:uncharacterized protein YndB with AHSA1/START domain
MSKTTVTKDGKNLIIETLVSAPKDKVWKAYTTPALFSKWWGPKGWTTTVKHMEFKPGGYLLYGMKCEDKNQTDWYGKYSWGRSNYETITPNDNFTYTDYFCDENGNVTEGMPATKIDLSFEEVDGKTKVTSVGTYETEEGLATVLEMGMEEGIKQTLDRLGDLLE